MAKTSREEEERLLQELLGRAPNAQPRTRMLSVAWCCDACGEVFKTADSGPCPAPCVRCGGVCFSS